MEAVETTGAIRRAKLPSECHRQNSILQAGSLSCRLSACLLVIMTTVSTHIVLHFSSRLPRAGSGVVRIDPLRFLAGCRKRQLNQA